jgi:hypothetical protein
MHTRVTGTNIPVPPVCFLAHIGTKNMATVTATGTTADLVANAATLIEQLDAKLSTATAEVSSAKAKIVAALTVQQAAHQKEVDATAALIAKANPGATQKADTAAAFILTASPQVQGVTVFLGKNWRYVLIALAVGFLAYAKVGLHLV